MSQCPIEQYNKPTRQGVRKMLFVQYIEVILHSTSDDSHGPGEAGEKKSKQQESLPETETEKHGKGCRHRTGELNVFE